MILSHITFWNVWYFCEVGLKILETSGESLTLSFQKLVFSAILKLDFLKVQA
jgi:hypothetical protein